MSQRQLGPIIGATLLHSDIDHVINTYQKTLGFSLVDENEVSSEMAKLWSSPKLIGNRMAVMSSANGDAWLRIIEDHQAQPANPLKSYGWMALETNVANVDVIRAKFSNQASTNKNLNNDSFTVIGEPAYLQVSDAIKAMQVIGPAGEVSYLTQVDRNVPPFELPQTTAETGSLFIPVLCTPNREQSLDFYQSLNNADKGLCFNTKITVLNKTWGHDIEHQYQVATLQLDGKCLFEIDQVPNAEPVTNNEGSLPSGIALISCRVKDVEYIAKVFNVDVHKIKDSYYKNLSSILLKGPAGELIELIG